MKSINESPSTADTDDISTVEQWYMHGIDLEQFADERVAGVLSKMAVSQHDVTRLLRDAAIDTAKGLGVVLIAELVRQGLLWLGGSPVDALRDVLCELKDLRENSSVKKG